MSRGATVGTIAGFSAGVFLAILFGISAAPSRPDLFTAEASAADVAVPVSEPLASWTREVPPLDPPSIALPPGHPMPTGVPTVIHPMPAGSPHVTPHPPGVGMAPVHATAPLDPYGPPMQTSERMHIPPAGYGPPPTGYPGPVADPVVYRVQHLPATALATTLEKALPQWVALQIAVEPIGNTLILSGHNADMAQKLLTELDRAPRQVDIEVAMIKTVLTREAVEQLVADYIDGKGQGSTALDLRALIDQLAAPGQISGTDMLALTTVDNQPGYVQIGQRISRGEKGQMENTGRILGATPRVSGNRITIEIDMETSDVSQDVNDSIRVQTLQTTVGLESGQILCLGGARQIMKANNDEIRGEQILFLLRAVAHD